MVKTCSNCKKIKQIVNFSKCLRNSDGLQSRCKECCKQATLKSRQKRLSQDPEADKRVKRIWYKKNQELSKERTRKYRLEHPEWAKEADAKHRVLYNWRVKFPEKAKDLGKRQAFKRKLKKYGLSPEQFQAMIDGQEGKCAICKIVPSGGLVIDHNHTSGKIRELLCNSCNPAVGMIGENPDIARKIIEYLTKHTLSNSPALEVTEMLPVNEQIVQ